MQINSSQFVISSTDPEKCPTDKRPEYAFIGRSNVGKSSLINMLTNHKGLAMTSAQPGKTMLINHFIINNEWYLVDLPGYGYARRGKDGREKIQIIIEDYILERLDMTLLFVLLDIRHEPQKIDLEFMEWLGENNVPFAIVFTKLDKIGRMVYQQSRKRYEEKLLESWDELPPIFGTSSTTAAGREEILSFIEEINRTLPAPAKHK